MMASLTLDDRTPTTPLPALATKTKNVAHFGGENGLKSSVITSTSVKKIDRLASKTSMCSIYNEVGVWPGTEYKQTNIAGQLVEEEFWVDIIDKILVEVVAGKKDEISSFSRKIGGNKAQTRISQWFRTENLRFPPKRNEYMGVECTDKNDSSVMKSKKKYKQTSILKFQKFSEIVRSEQWGNQKTSRKRKMENRDDSKSDKQQQEQDKKSGKRLKLFVCSSSNKSKVSADKWVDTELKTDLEHHNLNPPKQQIVDPLPLPQHPEPTSIVVGATPKGNILDVDADGVGDVSPEVAGKEDTGAGEIKECNVGSVRASTPTGGEGSASVVEPLTPPAIEELTPLASTPVEDNNPLLAPKKEKGFWLLRAERDRSRRGVSPTTSSRLSVASRIMDSKAEDDSGLETEKNVVRNVLSSGDVSMISVGTANLSEVTGEVVVDGEIKIKVDAEAVGEVVAGEEVRLEAVDSSRELSAAEDNAEAVGEVVAGGDSRVEEVDSSSDLGAEDNVEEREVHNRFQESLNSLREVLSDSDQDSFSSLGMGNDGVRVEMFEMMDRIEADHEWTRYSDPNLEEEFVNVVRQYIHNPEQMSDIVGTSFGDPSWNQSSFNDVGGRGTLGRVWRRLKELELVVGVKRLRTSISEASSDELISLSSSISTNRMMDHRLSDLDELAVSVDSHSSSVISALRLRIAELGVESEDSHSSSDSSDSYTEMDNGERILRFRDDVVLLNTRQRDGADDFSAEE